MGRGGIVFGGGSTVTQSRPQAQENAYEQCLTGNCGTAATYGKEIMNRVAAPVISSSASASPSAKSVLTTPTQDTAGVVELGEGIHARIKDGKILATISLTSKQAAGKVEYGYQGNAASGNRRAKADSNLSNLVKSEVGGLTVEKGKFNNGEMFVNVYAANDLDTVTLKFTDAEGTTKEVTISRDEIIKKQAGSSQGSGTVEKSPTVGTGTTSAPSLDKTTSPSDIVQPATSATRPSNIQTVAPEGGGTETTTSPQPAQTAGTSEPAQGTLNSSQTTNTAVEQLKSYLSAEQKVLRRFLFSTTKTTVFTDLTAAGDLLRNKSATEKVELLSAVGIPAITTTLKRLAHDDRPAAVKQLIGEDLMKQLETFNSNLSVGFFWSDKTALKAIDGLSADEKKLLGIGWDVVYRGSLRKTLEFQKQLDYELDKPQQ